MCLSPLCLCSKVTVPSAATNALWSAMQTLEQAFEQWGVALENTDWSQVSAVEERNLHLHLQSLIFKNALSSLPSTLLKPRENSIALWEVIEHVGSTHWPLLQEVVSGDGGALVRAASSIPMADARKFGQALINVAQLCDRSLPLLSVFIQEEVARTSTEGNLFRNNSVASSMCSHFLDLEGSEHIHKALAESMKALLECNVSFEIDSGRLVDEKGGRVGGDIQLSEEEFKVLILPPTPQELRAAENLDGNRAVLESMTRRFVNDITASASTCPRRTQELLELLRTGVRQKFPEAELGCVGALYFLRFLCPKILAPESWLNTGSVAHHVKRNRLILIKVLQALANGVEFGPQDPMAALNPFLLSEFPRMKAFFLQVSTPRRGYTGFPVVDTRSMKTRVQAVSSDLQYLSTVLTPSPTLSLGGTTATASSSNLRGKDARGFIRSKKTEGKSSFDHSALSASTSFHTTRPARSKPPLFPSPSLSPAPYSPLAMTLPLSPLSASTSASFLLSSTPSSVASLAATSTTIRAATTTTCATLSCPALTSSSSALPSSSSSSSSSSPSSSAPISQEEASRILVEFCAAGNKEGVDHVLLKLRVDVNMSFHGTTALQESCKRGDASIVDCLLRAGADVGARSVKAGCFCSSRESTVEDAWWNDNYQRGRRTGTSETPSHAAVQAASIESLELLLTAHLLNAQDCSRRRFCFLNQLDTSGFTLLRKASFCGQLSVVEWLVEQGANPNGDLEGPRPLQDAAERGWVDIAAFLLTRGADPNCGNSEGHSSLRPPLVLAIIQGDRRMVQLFLELGTNLSLEQWQQLEQETDGTPKATHIKTMREFVRSWELLATAQGSIYFSQSEVKRPEKTVLYVD